MGEQERILEMIEKGQITAAEGMELLRALNTVNFSNTSNTSNTSGTANATDDPSYLNFSNKNRLDGPGTTYSSIERKYRFLKIKVTSDNNTVNVNLNIPTRLLTTLGGLTRKLVKMIPKDAREKMEDKGVDISDIDFVQIIEDIISGTLDDPNIIDVEAWDEEHQTMIMVKIYVE